MADERAPAARKSVVKTQFDTAVSCQNAGKLAQAVALYGDVVRQAPGFAVAWGNMGVALRALGRTEAGLTCLKRAVALKSDDSGMWSNLGNAYRAAGDLMAASDAHRRAVELDPGRGQSHYNRALALRDCGDFAGAEACFDDPLAHDYDKP